MKENVTLTRAEQNRVHVLDGHLTAADAAELLFLELPRFRGHLNRQGDNVTELQQLSA